jgi:hypothetical protein
VFDVVGSLCIGLGVAGAIVPTISKGAYDGGTSGGAGGDFGSKKFLCSSHFLSSLNPICSPLTPRSFGELRDASTPIDIRHPQAEIVNGRSVADLRRTLMAQLRNLLKEKAEMLDLNRRLQWTRLARQRSLVGTVQIVASWLEK